MREPQSIDRRCEPKLEESRRISQQLREIGHSRRASSLLAVGERSYRTNVSITDGTPTSVGIKPKIKKFD